MRTRKGAFADSQTYPVRLPTTIGMEGAGTVERVGAGVIGFRPGDRVAYCLVWSSHAEYAVVPDWQLAHVPPGVPLCLAAAATFQGFTAHYLATDVGRLGPGRSCLVHAAAGGVGQLLVGFATSLGATVYGTVRTEDDKRIARERGAQAVFLSDSGGFVAPSLELTGGAGVDVVFDSVGKPTLRDDFKVTRKKGLVVNFGASGGAVDDLNPAELGEAESLYLTRPRLKNHLSDADTVQARATDLDCRAHRWHAVAGQALRDGTDRPGARQRGRAQNGRQAAARHSCRTGLSRSSEPLHWSLATRRNAVKHHHVGANGITLRAVKWGDAPAVRRSNPSPTWLARSLASRSVNHRSSSRAKPTGLERCAPSRRMASVGPCTACVGSSHWME